GGAAVSVYDPEAMANVRDIYGDRLTYATGPYDALAGADCLVIVTEWGDFRRPDFDEMARRMASRTIFDGRNLYAPAEMKSRGFAYHAIGKAAV
ncbi:MAG: UDP binding domain-containing protein, partial [Planctomycetaceae bacterium]